jgi:hypothetical protein
MFHSRSALTPLIAYQPLYVAGELPSDKPTEIAHIQP